MAQRLGASVTAGRMRRLHRQPRQLRTVYADASGSQQRRSRAASHRFALTRTSSYDDARSRRSARHRLWCAQRRNAAAADERTAAHQLRSTRSGDGQRFGDVRHCGRCRTQLSVQASRGRREPTQSHRRDARAGRHRAGPCTAPAFVDVRDRRRRLYRRRSRGRARRFLSQHLALLS